MSDSPFYSLDNQGNLVLRLHVLPRASRDAIDGLHGPRLKVRITAPPVEGRANDHLTRYLAGELGIGSSRIHLIGEHSREKTLRISALSPPERERLLDWCRRRQPGALRDETKKTGS